MNSNNNQPLILAFAFLVIGVLGTLLYMANQEPMQQYEVQESAYTIQAVNPVPSVDSMATHYVRITQDANTSVAQIQRYNDTQATNAQVAVSTLVPAATPG